MPSGRKFAWLWVRDLIVELGGTMIEYIEWVIYTISYRQSLDMNF